MKSLRGCFEALAVSSLVLLPAACAFARDEPQSPEAGALTPTAARAAIDEMYQAWGRGRVALDTKTLDAIMAPDFYVLLYGKRLSRDKFLHDITQKRAGARLTRFDTDILTVQRTGQEWTVVISEKLEYTKSGAEGETKKAHSFWVTRDGWRYDGQKWLVTYSEAIGHESWKPGTRPAIRDW